MRPTLRFISILLPCCLFGELSIEQMTLQDAELIALENNKQFLIAKESVTQATQRKKQAVSKWLPSVHYRGEFRQIEPKEAFFNIFKPTLDVFNQGYSSILQLDQPLFSTDLLFGLRAKELEMQATHFEQANTQNELLRALRDQYYAVVASEISLEINRENVGYLTYALDKEQEKLQAGASTPFEVNQSKTAVANAISEYYSALRQLKNHRNAFVLTLGIDPLLEPKISLRETKIPFESIPELAIKLGQVQTKYHYKLSDFSTAADFSHRISQIDQARKLLLFSEREVVYYLDLAIENRPDLASRKLLVGVAEQNVSLKQGTYLPKILGYARFSYNDVDLGPEPFFDQPYHWSCGVTLSWNLFDSLLREHEISEAKSKRSATRLQYEQELDRVEVEVRNGLYQLEEAIFGYLSANEAVLLAEQARFQAAEKLEYGRISTLEYRDSVNQLALAKNLRNKASFELIAAYYELRYATGADATFQQS